ncbi:DUF2169 domain-containing protein [Labrys sp. LIt4]|uniref:DUF2169 family type VI secretion system accessory protein n=1 Tax=Labrys sp. LIt4 TaxID=2821355 RepID=UPI001AE00880|nr:DUF2169 domain-containing protein [Labrys sp. LIt4]MBP0583478.1 DUF2169 domain-containing protein [Labrys sp. LIt4]
MPDVRNYTPFPNFRFYATDNQAREFGVIIVKATYEIAPSGRLLVAEEQAPMMFDDECHGEVNVSSLWHPSDLVPVKPTTDVIVNAIAHAPGGEPRPSWTCGITIEGTENSHTKRLRVTGPRQWLPRWKRPLTEHEKQEWQKHRRWFEGWELSESEPIASLPLRYEYAYGGLLPKGEDENGQAVIDTNPHNPLGLGWIDQEWTDHTRPQPAPRIEAADEPITDAYRIYAPQSLGPIPPAWEPRYPHGGTYDDEWKAKVWPRWPADYDFAYHNSAHPDLILDSYLGGDERIRLTNLLLERADFSFRLPGEKLAVDFAGENGETVRHEMNLDTLFLDIADTNPRYRRIYLSWRARFEPDRFVTANIHRIGRPEDSVAVTKRIKEGQYA